MATGGETDRDVEAPEPGSELEQADPEVVELRQENELLQRQIERAKADLANIRKRHRKELDQAREHGLVTFAAELLPVLDNFHLALGAHQEKKSRDDTEDQSMIDGLLMVHGLLEGALERHGLIEITALGGDFDPRLHEAIGIDPQSDAPPGKVTQIVQRGYMIGDKILRASRVLVSGEGKKNDTKGDSSTEE